MQDTVAEFVRRAVLGEKDAFGVLVDQHRDVVFSICFSRCRNFTDAQDLAQEAFIRAYANLHQLREPDKFAAWLYRITHAVCARWFRDLRYISVPLEDAITDPLPAFQVEDELYKREMQCLVGDALVQLPENLKLAATLHYICGYTCNEIGNMTGVTEGNVKEKLRNARKYLKKYFMGRFAEEAKYRKPGKALTRKILSGITSFEKEEIFSHLRALKAILEYHGERVDWDYLLGASGEAFGVYFSSSWTYHTRYVHSWDVLKTACDAYGYIGKWRLNDSFEATLDFIDSNLQHGLPIASPGINPSTSDSRVSESHYWFVVKGVDRKDQQFSLSGVGEQDSLVPYPWFRRHNSFGWLGVVRSFEVCREFIAHNPVFAVSPRNDPVNKRSVIVESLYRAVQLAREEPTCYIDYEPVEVAGGIGALREWSNSIRQTLSLDLSSYACRQNSHCGHHAGVMYGGARRMEDSRRAAASYIHSLAESGLGFPETELIEVANKYESIASASHQLFELYFNPAEELMMKKAVTKYPKPEYFFIEESIRFWKTFEQRFYQDPKQREVGARLIDYIAEQETKAIRILDKLAAEWV